MIVDRLTKSTHFLLVNVEDSLEKLAQLYVDEIVRLHRVPVSIVPDRDPRVIQDSRHLPCFDVKEIHPRSFTCAERAASATKGEPDL